MVGPEVIFKYFPDITAEQKEKFSALSAIYSDLNSKVNVISRKDMDEFYTRHVLHSLSIALLCDFKPVKQVLDFGTGGGFPGIPLSIMFPVTAFHLVDSIGRKTEVVRSVCQKLRLTNVNVEKARVEDLRGKFDMITCRAVARLADFYPWIADKMSRNTLLACLKGGDLGDEIFEFLQKHPGLKVEAKPLSLCFEEDFFETKKLVLIRSARIK
jgi:16S rRNA (guanine527-N7)-methyltransferase